MLLSWSTSDTVLNSMNSTGMMLCEPGVSYISHSQTVIGLPKIYLSGWYLNQEAEKSMRESYAVDFNIVLG